MARLIVGRLLQMIPLLLGITMITFALVNLVPGSPVTNLEFSPGTRPEDIERIRQNLGLDQPVHTRYVHWLSNIARGDLGISLRTFRPVRDSILERLPNTLLLTGSALAVSLAFSIPVGIYAAMRRNSWFDQLSTVAAVAGIAVPNFWLGLLMILLFSVYFREWGLPALPSGGSVTLGAEGGGLWDRVQHLIMPVIVLAFVQTASWTRYLRSQMIEILRQDYMRSAEAKGLRERLVVIRHGLRNAMLPLVTLVALDIPTLFSGALVVEVVFSYPGLGRFIFDATTQRDYTVVMGVVLVVSVLTILANLLADIIHGLLDPRIRYD